MIYKFEVEMDFGKVDTLDENDKKIIDAAKRSIEKIANIACLTIRADNGDEDAAFDLMIATMNYANEKANKIKEKSKIIEYNDFTISAKEENKDDKKTD